MTVAEIIQAARAKPAQLISVVFKTPHRASHCLREIMELCRQTTEFQRLDKRAILLPNVSEIHCFVLQNFDQVRSFRSDHLIVSERGAFPKDWIDQMVYRCRSDKYSYLLESIDPNTAPPRILSPKLGTIVRLANTAQDVYVVSGYYTDPVYGRVSNHWNWRRVLSDGRLGYLEQGYGAFRETPNKYDIEITAKLK